MTEKREQIKITIYEDELSALYSTLGKTANFSGVLQMTEEEYNIIKNIEARLRKLKAIRIARQLIESGEV